MNNKKFLLILLFGLFLFIPRDSFALGIGVNKGGLPDVSCSNCTSINPSASNISSLTFILENPGLQSGNTYNNSVYFTIVTNSKDVNIASTNWYIGSYDFPGNQGNSFYRESVTAKDGAYYIKFALGHQHKCITTNTIDTFKVTVNLTPVNSNVYIYSVQDLVQTTKVYGEDNSALIQNSTQLIIENNNNNFNKLIEENKKNQQQQHEDSQKQLEESKKTNDLIESDDTSKSEEQANSFFDNFKDDDYGLSDVITMPLTFIKGLANNSCNALNLPLPFVNKNATLPCMTSIYQEHFGAFLKIYQIITTGFISYWVCINIFALVQGFKNPDNDKVEVMEL